MTTTAESVPAHATGEAGGATPSRRLMLGALGVVFGDIGTSPIYALRESVRAGGSVDEAAIIGILSLVIWAVVLVVALKYVILVMRADNDGEGGTMALLSLAVPVAGRWRETLLLVGLGGASLFFGDAMITPAISVLSAVEGLEIVAPGLEPYVVPLACCILVALFAIQRQGSGRVGRFFGPVMLAWFLTLAALGLARIPAHPGVLAAFNPAHAVGYLAHAQGWVAFAVLGSVFLALTGGEALYADMGHFGRRPIRIDWFALVMPALLLNYLGQAALILSEPATAKNPFFLLVPEAFLVPFVILTTAATVIASQAVISGAFALVQQAIGLGALPRLDIRQTSATSAGQVYVPQVNWLLAIAVLALVLGFRRSDALANAYGIAVAGDMLVTTLLVATVARGVWGWPAPAVMAIAGAFLLLDVTFVASNLHKIPGGGWFPLVVGGVSLLMMSAWHRGRAVAIARRAEDAQPLDAFVASLSGTDGPVRVPGVAIYLTTQTKAVPAALALNLRHNHVVHEALVILKVSTARRPWVGEDDRLSVGDLSHGVRLAELRFGFAEKPDVPETLKRHAGKIDCDLADASFFLGREVPIPSLRPDVPRWAEHIYAFLTRNAVSAPDYFLIPSASVIEMGTKVEI